MEQEVEFSSEPTKQQKVGKIEWKGLENGLWKARVGKVGVGWGGAENGEKREREWERTATQLFRLLTAGHISCENDFKAKQNRIFLYFLFMNENQPDSSRKSTNNS